MAWWNQYNLRLDFLFTIQYAFFSNLIADESRQSDSVGVEYASRHRSNHYTCDNDSDTTPIFGCHPVADDYIE